MAQELVARRPFGPTSDSVSIMGLGGYHVGQASSIAAAVRIVHDALERAKQAGKVRYVGFAGHKDPEIHLRMLASGCPFDACQLPLNGFDAAFRRFQATVLPELARRHIAAIGMKSLGGDGRVVVYKTSAEHEGEVGRQQHGFTSQEELAL